MRRMLFLFLAVMFVLSMIVRSEAITQFSIDDRVKTVGVSVVTTEVGKASAITTYNRILGYTIAANADSIVSIWDATAAQANSAGTFVRTATRVIAEDALDVDDGDSSKTVWFCYPRDIEYGVVVSATATTHVTLFYE